VKKIELGKKEISELEIGEGKVSFYAETGHEVQDTIDSTTTNLENCLVDAMRIRKFDSSRDVYLRICFEIQEGEYLEHWVKILDSTGKVLIKFPS